MPRPMPRVAPVTRADRPPGSDMAGEDLETGLQERRDAGPELGVVAGTVAADPLAVGDAFGDRSELVVGQAEVEDPVDRAGPGRLLVAQPQLVGIGEGLVGPRRLQAED